MLKGCAADVDVAAGLSCGRGFVAVVSCADTACAPARDAVERENVRADNVADEEPLPLPLCFASCLKHLWQIMLLVYVNAIESSSTQVGSNVVCGVVSEERPWITCIKVNLRNNHMR